MAMRPPTGRNLFLMLFLLSCLFHGYAAANDFPTSYSQGSYDEYADELGYIQEESSGYPDGEYQYATDIPEPESPPPPPVVPLPPVELEKKDVLIGRTPYLSLKEMMRQVSGLFAFLKKEMGVKEVRMVTSQDYASALAALNRGSIDFAWVGPMAYVIAREKGGLMALAKAQHQGGAAYRGVFITRRNSRVLGLDDIRGRTVGFVDPESASGYLYPLYLLKRIRIDPHKDCARVLFLKKHDAVLQAVLEGKIDAGVCLEATLEAVNDPQIRNQILVLGKTDEVPSDVLVCRQDCPINLRESFLKALLKLTATGSASKAGPSDPEQLTFAPATDEDFQSVQAVWKAVRSAARRP